MCVCSMDPKPSETDNRMLKKSWEYKNISHKIFQCYIKSIMYSMQEDYESLIKIISSSTE
jgi:hypothetical protein